MKSPFIQLSFLSPHSTPCLPLFLFPSFLYPQIAHLRFSIPLFSLTRFSSSYSSSHLSNPHFSLNEFSLFRLVFFLSSPKSPSSSLHPTSIPIFPQPLRSHPQLCIPHVTSHLHFLIPKGPTSSSSFPVIPRLPFSLSPLFLLCLRIPQRVLPHPLISKIPTSSSPSLPLPSISPTGCRP